MADARKVNESWPADTPDDVVQMADVIWDVIRGQGSDVAGPAMMITLTRMIVNMRQTETSGQDIANILNDIGKLVTRWGAAYSREN